MIALPGDNGAPRPPGQPGKERYILAVLRAIILKSANSLLSDKFWANEEKQGVFQLNQCPNCHALPPGYRSGLKIIQGSQYVHIEIRVSCEQCGIEGEGTEMKLPYSQAGGG